MLGDRWVYPDPRALVRPDVTSEEFQRIMCFVHVGGTIKITWADRQAEADQLLLDHVDLAGADIVEVGCSDGSTSVDLINRLGDFGSFVMTDRFLEIEWVEVDGRWVFFDKTGACILVSGRRFMGWPELSGVVRSAFGRTIRTASTLERRPCLLLNPDARRLMESDPRVRADEYDVFTPWPGPPVDVVKTGNLLRRLYFPDDQILQGLTRLHGALVDGGHLLLADHSRVQGEPPAGGLYRRSPTGFEPVASTDRRPEIDDLVRALDVSADRSSSRGSE